MSYITMYGCATAVMGVLAGAAFGGRDYKWAGFFASQTLFLTAMFVAQSFKGVA